MNPVGWYVTVPDLYDQTYQHHLSELRRTYDLRGDQSTSISLHLPPDPRAKTSHDPSRRCVSASEVRAIVARARRTEIRPDSGSTSVMNPYALASSAA